MRSVNSPYIGVVVMVNSFCIQWIRAADSFRMGGMVWFLMVGILSPLVAVAQPTVTSLVLTERSILNRKTTPPRDTLFDQVVRYGDTLFMDAVVDGVDAGYFNGDTLLLTLLPDVSAFRGGLIEGPTITRISELNRIQVRYVFVVDPNKQLALGNYINVKAKFSVRESAGIESPIVESNWFFIENYPPALSPTSTLFYVLRNGVPDEIENYRRLNRGEHAIVSPGDILWVTTTIVENEIYTEIYPEDIVLDISDFGYPEPITAASPMAQRFGKQTVAYVTWKFPIPADVTPTSSPNGANLIFSVTDSAYCSNSIVISTSIDVRLYPYHFTPTFTKDEKELGVSQIPVKLLSGYVDRYGGPDFAVAGGGSAPTELYLSSSPGIFDLPFPLLRPASGNVSSLAFADMNGDDLLDIIAGTYNGANEVWLGRDPVPPGEPYYLVYPFGQADDRTWALAVGDVNGDAARDVVTGNWNQPLHVYFGDGLGHVGGSPEAEQSLGSSQACIMDIALGDADGDGDLDIVAVRDRQPILVYFNDGTGHFSEENVYEVAPQITPTHYSSLVFVDLDKDTDLDIVAGSWLPRDLNYVFLNDGTGRFGASPESIKSFGSAQISVWDLDAGDVDGDFFPDIATASMTYTPLAGQQNTIYLNDGSGGFGGVDREINIGAGDDLTRCIHLMDVEEDGDLDVVTANLQQKGAIFRSNRLDNAW